MKARIKIESFDSSIWKVMQPTNHRESVHLVEEGDCISTTGMEFDYLFEVAGIRANAVELTIRPDVMLHAQESSRQVGTLTLEVGEAATLQTLTLDAWGNWVVSLEGIE
jgi:hypothetical protein